MSSKEGKVAVDLTTGIVGRWKETYQWIPIFKAFATIAMAFSAGANNLAAPVGQSPFLFSLFYFYFPAIRMCHCLIMQNENHNFNGVLLWNSLEWTVAPLISCLCSYIFFRLLRAFLLDLKMQRKGSSFSSLSTMEYVLESGLLCLFVIFQVCFFYFVKIKFNIIWATKNSRSMETLNLSIKFCYSLDVPIVLSFYSCPGLNLVLQQVVIVSLTIRKSNDIPNCKSNKQSRSIDQQCIEIQDKTSSIKGDEKNHEDIEEMSRDFMQTRVLETVCEDEERSWESPLPDKIHDSDQQQIQDFQQTQSVSQKRSTDQLTPFKQLLESTPNRLVQTRNFQRIEKRTVASDAPRYIRKFAISIRRPVEKVLEYDRRTLVRHALAEKYDEMEDFFSFPHLLASCIFALQSAIEVAANASPYAAFLDVFDHRIKYLRNGEEAVGVICDVHVKWWFRAISGLVAAMGFFLCGWRLTRCLGGKLTCMSNSRGLASQLSSVAAMVMVTRMNLPASSIHVFVGSLLGVGMVDGIRSSNWNPVLKFLGGWILTVTFSCGIAYLIFSASVHSPGYVVP
ncbi:hypothetical protein SADUNF_Sadunf04G0041400 [Salix dunnii]|uniref:Phosphate transporter n=1 Tax=Salix dunnii TaxID=1413687 RepID=A0A835KER2_9ROSI|nr:hypothetical protein SADUNF_Sadunf04G0041400 [Salix dunnii]